MTAPNSPDGSVSTGVGDALLPCPFCGNEGVLEPSADDEDYEGPIFWSVGCSCTAFVGPWATEAEAAQAWNTRPSGWQPIETANTSSLFARSQWSLIATDGGRVTEGMPFYQGDGSFIWICARGGNCSDGHDPNGQSAYLPDRVMYIMSLPAPPSTDAPQGQPS